jgi:hypothetical protein
MFGGKRGEKLHPQEDLLIAQEAMDASLESNYSVEEITRSFTELERQMMQAEGRTPSENFEALFNYSEKARQACDTAGDHDATGFFIAKTQTYQTLLEVLAPKLKIKPSKTDTTKTDMSGRKESRI